MSDLNIYLTSLEPDMSQSIYSQSLGGYCSNSLVYPETTLAQNIGLYDVSFSLDIPSEGNWSNWTGTTFININNELIEISPLENGSIVVEKRGYNNIINMHLEGDIVRASSKKELFNNVFNTDYKQYRCIAVKNTGEMVAKDIVVFLRQNSRSEDCSIKISIEKPKSQYLTSTSTSRTSLTLIDSALIGLYEDNYFAEAYLKPSGETGRIIHTFDSATGTFTFYDSYSSTVTNKEYEIYPAPSQRIKTGTISPSSSNLITSFSEATEDSPLYLSLTGSKQISSEDDLNHNDLFYVWIERSVEKGSLETDNDDFIININYTSGS